MATRHSTLIPAVGYLRRSTAKQEKSIADQRRAIECYAREHGYRLVRWYTDDGVSGDATEKRDGFLQMRKDIDPGDFEAVICWDQDRFGRFDSLDAGYWIKPFRDAGVTLVTLNEGPINWNDFAGRLMYNIKQEGKHQFLRDLSRNTAAARSATPGTATFAARRPRTATIGCWWTKRAITGNVFATASSTLSRAWRVTLVPSDDPEKVETAKWLFHTYADTDTGLRLMADQLNERGVPGPRGGPWYAASIKEILKNDKYTGTFFWPKRREGKYHCVAAGEIKPRTDGPGVQDNPPEAQITTEDAHEGLVDQATFERVQKKLHERRRARSPGEGYPFRTHTRKNRDAYLLSGLVFCSHCGARMHGTMCSRKKNGKVYKYPKYICSTYCRSGKNNPSGCGYHNIHQSVIVSVLLRKLQEAFLIGSSKKRLHDEVKKRLAAQSKPDGRRLAALRRRLHKLDRDIDRAADRLLTAPEDLMDILAPKVSAMKKQRGRVAADLAQAELAGQPIDLEKEADAVVDRLWQLGEELQGADPARLRELIQRMVRRVELQFNHVRRGKRVECPVAAGTIYLRTDSDLFCSVSRGDWPSFEPLIAACVDAALAQSAETIVATRVVRLSA